MAAGLVGGDDEEDDDENNCDYSVGFSVFYASVSSSTLFRPPLFSPSL